MKQILRSLLILIGLSAFSFSLYVHLMSYRDVNVTADTTFNGVTTVLSILYFMVSAAVFLAIHGRGHANQQGLKQPYPILNVLLTIAAFNTMGHHFFNDAPPGEFIEANDSYIHRVKGQPDYIFESRELFLDAKIPGERKQTQQQSAWWITLFLAPCTTLLVRKPRASDERDGYGLIAPSMAPADPNTLPSTAPEQASQSDQRLNENQSAPVLRIRTHHFLLLGLLGTFAWTSMKPSPDDVTMPPGPTIETQAGADFDADAPKASVGEDHDPLSNRTIQSCLQGTASACSRLEAMSQLMARRCSSGQPDTCRLLMKLCALDNQAWACEAHRELVTNTIAQCTNQQDTACTTLDRWVSNQILPTDTDQLQQKAQNATCDILGKHCVVAAQDCSGSKLDASCHPEMVFYKGGTFTRGCPPDDPVCAPESTIATNRNDSPAHEVFLSPFLLDRREVTVADFRQCVAEKRCYAQFRCGNDQPHYTQPNSESLPMNCVTWFAAQAYCASKGKRLPTEAEWEYAARNAGASDRYPWGSKEANCQRATFDGCGSKAKAPCSTPLGSSRQGVCDLAGNLQEWVFDKYHGDYYQAQERLNPSGPQIGYVQPGDKDYLAWRSQRGGDYRGGVESLHATARSAMFPGDQAGHVGFRCAKDDIVSRAMTLKEKIPQRFDDFVGSLRHDLIRSPGQECVQNPVIRQLINAYLFYYYYSETYSITGFRGHAWFSHLQIPTLANLTKGADAVTTAKANLGYIATLLLNYYERIRLDPEWDSKFHFLDYQHHEHAKRSARSEPESFEVDLDAVNHVAGLTGLGGNEPDKIIWRNSIYYDLGFPKSPSPCLSENISYWNTSAVTDAELRSVDTYSSLDYWLYSFWFRRYRENTTELVHAVLKTIAQDPPNGLDSLMSPEVPSQEASGYDESDGEQYVEGDEGHEEFQQEITEMENCNAQFNLGVPPQRLADFHYALLANLERGDKEAVIKMVNFPLRTPQLKDFKFTTPDDLRKHYDTVFTDAITQAVANQHPISLFCNYQGAMYGSGALWFNNFNESERFRIVTINH